MLPSVFYHCVGRNKTNFDREIEAIHLPLQKLTYPNSPNTFQKTVLMVDSQAASQAVFSKKQPQSEKIHSIKQLLKRLKSFNYHVPVSYTHLDVYKRQATHSTFLACRGSLS